VPFLDGSAKFISSSIDSVERGDGIFTFDFINDEFNFSPGKGLFGSFFQIS
jgi:hypothetical protein